MTSEERRRGRRRASEVEQEVRRLLDAGLENQALLADLEALSRELAFEGFTWLWGPALYDRSRVVFRPFVLSHFGSWLLDPGGKPQALKVRRVDWKGEIGERLERWLAKVDEDDDVELFRRLYEWKHRPRGFGRPDFEARRRDLVRRYEAASTSTERSMVLAKLDLWLELDEATALALYSRDPRASTSFILRHLPVRWGWRGEKRELWSQLAESARRAGDDELYFQLYRRQAPVGRWSSDVLRLCESWPVGDASGLRRELDRHHPAGFGLDLGETYLAMLERRGRDVIPYLMGHLREVRDSAWRRTAYDRLVALARERGWLDLWAALVRVAAAPKEWNREVDAVVRDHAMTADEKRRRLSMLAGVSRQVHLPGLSLLHVRPFDDTVALGLYESFPDLVGGPLKAHVAPTWGAWRAKLVDAAIARGDEGLLDFLASRLVTRGTAYDPGGLGKLVDRLANHYEQLRDDPERFARRAASVLGQVPAYSIFDYDGLVAGNRLARLLFERSASSYLASAPALSDLVEAPEIHVQALAYRILGQDDDRARAAAEACLDVLIGTLLRPLHSRTRIVAFSALLNAAHAEEPARRVLARARDALGLPDLRYPKEQLVGLIGQILHRWPELRGRDEQPVVYRAAEEASP